MNNPLSTQEIEAMFLAYCERQSANYVSAKCGVNYLTAKRYRDKHGWDGRTDGTS
jgi:hypothetical protein